MKPSMIGAPLCVVLAMVGRATAVSHEVKITNYKFTPDSLTVAVDDTVKWTCDQGVHSSTSGTPGHPDGKWDSGYLNPGNSFSYGFADSGRYPYYCIPHGFTGVIVVAGSGLSEKTGYRRLHATSVTPNPFSGSTTISYTLSRATRVTLAVYDATGQLIRTLVNGPGQAGFNQVVWDGADDAGQRVGAGIYFGRCRAVDFEQFEKLIKVK